MMYQSISQHKPTSLSLRKACEVVSVSSSGYFKNLKRKSLTSFIPKLLDKDVLRSFHIHKGYYGYRKISQSLLKEGSSCSVDQARRVLSQYGLKAKTAKTFRPRTTQAGTTPSQRIFKTTETILTDINQVWGSDITYLKAKEQKFLYLAIFMDFYSRKIVGWNLSHSLSKDLVVRAFNRSLETRSVGGGLLVHSDRGVQYTAGGFRDRLKDLGFIQSMSRKGNCYDNAYCESFFSLLKRELGNKVYSSLSEAREDIFEWIEGWYNTHRLHSSLGYKSPVEFENKMRITP